MSATLKASQRQERRVAAKYDGQVSSGSGNGWVRKNDVRSETWSFECKTTGKKSYSLKAAELRLAEQHAIRDGREMAFVVDLDGRTYVVLSEATFDSLVETAGVQ